ncbi:MAG TPA: TonB-dependent receptor [Candidatus Acidoferrales bacterium]|nr:TonB-dependent receptor [Candidatus Acidoferrales bacterium]
MPAHVRACRILLFSFVVLASALVCAPAPVRAQSVAIGTIAGTIVDAQTGLPVAGAIIRTPGGASAVSDEHGHFLLHSSASGAQALHIERSGYQPADTRPVDPRTAQASALTVSLQRAPTAGPLHVVGYTSVRAAESLQRASRIYRSLTAETLMTAGVYRVGDALRQLPALNNGITGDTASLGDDLELNIRGLGTLETTSTLDGHPIGLGIPGGYNYELSPLFGLRNVNVTYGSGGSDLFGVDAIGGVIDFQTIDPTLQQSLKFSQGYGTFDRSATIAQATGTAGRFGYAFAGGVSGLDGPIKDAYMYQPGAAYDQSATLPAVRDLAIYKDDSSAVAHGALAKLRYDLSPATDVTFTGVANSYWDDKTGNGDGDYLPAPTALAIGNHLLAKKSSSDPCPAGTFTATNANGVPNGQGPGGEPDGGMQCQTPQEYASFNTGWDGAGPAWQSFNFDDADLRVDSTGTTRQTTLDAYTNRYKNTVDRTFQLPFYDVPGDNASTRLDQVNGSGVILSERFIGRANALTAGASYLNLAYDIQSDGALKGAPIVDETALFLRNAYRPQASPLTVYTDAYFKHSTVTQTSYVDPRLSAVYTAGSNNVIRLAAGANTTQPSANLLDQRFTEQTPGGAGGGATISCSSLNSIGSIPSSLLRPERGVDEELSFGHRFREDSQAQLTFYSANINDKIYSAIEPLSTTGTAFIDPAFLQSVTQRIAAVCGAQDAPELLGVTGSLNVGHLLARGATLNGRLRVNARSFIDYDWALTSTVLVSVPTTLLRSQLTLVPGSQLPHIPLHTFDASYDALLGRAVEARYTVHAVSANNTKSLPPYNYSDLRFAIARGPNTVGITITNLFNQDAFIEGLRGEGVPLPLNRYATAANYAPLIGTSATEEFGLPYRQIVLTYNLQMR